MDVQRLEVKLTELERQYRAWHTPIRKVIDETSVKVNQDGYTETDQDHDIDRVYRQQYAVYNPRQAAYPVREAMLAAYINGTSDERAEIRAIAKRVPYTTSILFSYIQDCAECLETPADGWILRLAFVAASIQDYAIDYRDTDYVLAGLALAARTAGIDIELYGRAIAELCSAPVEKMPSMRLRLEHFHIFALHARHEL